MRRCFIMFNRSQAFSVLHLSFHNMSVFSYSIQTGCPPEQ